VRTYSRKAGRSERQARRGSPSKATKKGSGKKERQFGGAEPYKHQAHQKNCRSDQEEELGGYEIISRTSKKKKAETSGKGTPMNQRNGGWGTSQLKERSKKEKVAIKG